MPSAVIRGFEYDSERQRLDIVFTSSAVYRYFEVPGAVATQLRTARSKGEFFNKRIRHRYKVRRLDQAEPDLFDMTDARALGPGARASEDPDTRACDRSGRQEATPEPAEQSGAPRLT